MEENNLLESLGLGKHEAKLYFILIKKGESTAVELAKESGLHRRTVYDEIEKLQKKGLVNITIQKGVRHFAPTSPESLKVMLEEKNVILKNLLPQLLSQFKSHEKKVSVNIFEGAEGLKIVFSDILEEFRKKKEIIMTGAGLKAPQYMKYSFGYYAEELKVSSNWRLIEPDNEKIRDEIQSWGVTKNCRYISSKFSAPVGFTVYGDKTLIMLVENEPVIIRIVSESVANAFRDYFEILWQVAEK